MEEKVVFSGIQPTGRLHIGNLIGAVKTWKRLQDTASNVLFCIVDLHSITVNPVHSAKDSFDTAAYYLACGIDPAKSLIFLQSSVKEHTELCWLLSSITQIGLLNRMTQFKEKSGKNKERSSLGLYSYPVLMAADILLYNTNLVPVGDDQVQHIELARNIAQKFNQVYKVEHFSLPEIIKNQSGSRIMSLRDGTKKMSKSDMSEGARINLSDDKDLIAKKIKSAKTDSIEGFEFEEIEKRPEANNLLGILSSINGEAKKLLCKRIKNFKDLKEELTLALIEELKPIQYNLKQLKKDQVFNVLKTSAKKAREVASYNICKIKNIIGFLEV